LDEYLNTHVISGEATETSIITITALRQLIFTEGNEDTGYGHLRDRHSLYSVKNYWVGQKLDDPSKFHPKMMPIVDFIKIAEAVFDPENKNITKK
jgi:hypothetical protein